MLDIDGSIPFAIVARSDRIIFVGTTWRRSVLGLANRNKELIALPDLFPEPLSKPCSDLVRTVFSQGTTLRGLGFVNGILFGKSARQLDSIKTSEELCIIIFHPIQSRSEYQEFLAHPGTTWCPVQLLGPLADLRPREVQMLRMIGLGMSGAEMAKAIYRSLKTVEFHRNALGQKLGIHDRVELANLAVRSGVTALDQDEIEDVWRRFGGRNALRSDPDRNTTDKPGPDDSLSEVA